MLNRRHLLKCMSFFFFRLKLGKLKQSDSVQFGKVVMDACVISLSGITPNMSNSLYVLDPQNSHIEKMTVA